MYVQRTYVYTVFTSNYFTYGFEEPHKIVTKLQGREIHKKEVSKRYINNHTGVLTSHWLASREASSNLVANCRKVKM